MKMKILYYLLIESNRLGNKIIFPYFDAVLCEIIYDIKLSECAFGAFYLENVSFIIFIRVCKLFLHRTKTREILCR